MAERFKNTVSDKLGEECGVFGMYDFDDGDVASSIYYGLLALQHRGQESCGIAVSETYGPKGKVQAHKDMGLVNEAFDHDRIESLKGNRCGTCAIFHCRQQYQRKCTTACFELCQGYLGHGS